MKVNKISVLCPYPFPKGMAPTTRMVAYCKGLVQNAVETEVICFFPKVKEDSNLREGVIEGVKWSYVQQKRYDVSKFYNLLIERPKVIFRTLKYVRQSNKNKKIDYVLLSFDDPILQLIFTLSLRILGIKVAFIGDEYPKQIRQLKDKVPFSDILLFKMSHHLMSCRILMTNKLIDYYNKTVCKKPSFLLGSILDEKRFLFNDRSESSSPYLCYMGNMMLAKDNVDNIIEAFSLIADKYPELSLFLYGTPSSKDESFLLSLIKKNNLEDRVIIKGKAEYDDVPRVLSNATILVTSQPDTKRAEGGFPTKMGEYMMSRVPMIVTDVGEIKNYVQDGVTTYMVPPCNPNAYANKIDYILTHEEESYEVVKRAYDMATNQFSSEIATKELVSFLSSL